MKSLHFIFLGVNRSSDFEKLFCYVRNSIANKFVIFEIFRLSVTVQELVFACDLICIFGRMLSGPSVRAPSTFYTLASTDF